MDFPTVQFLCLFIHKINQKALFLEDRTERFICYSWGCFVPLTRARRDPSWPSESSAWDRFRRDARRASCPSEVFTIALPCNIVLCPPNARDPHTI